MRQIHPTLIFAVLLTLLGLVIASSNNHDFGHCENVVKRWAASSISQGVTKDKHTLRDLLFFLHVPRTGGRTYFHCFLKKLYPTSEECPRSYDKLHFDPRNPKCRLLVTHDDYSLMSKLPKEKTSVVTILRNPIDRVFSSYEFATEVAARFLVHPNLTSATQMAGRIRAKSKGVSTLDIWPWKYLVPWMREDLFARRDARTLGDINHTSSTDPYDMEDFVMPLQKYLNDPIAHEIVHNGATFQITGLTNNSYQTESHEVRHCVQKYKVLGAHVLQVAKKRLDSMLYVGLTEDHRESATVFANVVGAQVITQLAESNSNGQSVAETNISVQSSSFSVSESEKVDDQHSELDPKESQIASTEEIETSKNMTVEKLMDVYGSCITNLRKSQSIRRSKSLARIAPANFTKEARLQVPQHILQQMRSLNNLDLELYEYAKQIFAKEHNLATEELVAETLQESLENKFKDLDGSKALKIVTIVLPMILLVLYFLFVTARGRTLKVKI